MNIDIRSFAIFLSITNVLQVIALYIQFRINRKLQGLGWWASSSLLWALGFGFNYLRDDPFWGSFAIVANNALFFSGFSFVYVGVQHFFGRRERRGLLLISSIAFTMIAIYFTYLDNNLLARRVNFSLGLGVFCFIIAWALFVNKVRELKAAAHFLALVFLASGILYMLRALSPFFSGPMGDIFIASTTQVVSYFGALILSVWSAFGFIILVNQRLKMEISEVSANLELIFNTSPDSVLITRMEDGSFVAINDGFTELTGYEREDVIGKTVYEINLWHDINGCDPFVTLLNKQGNYGNLETYFRLKDGQLRIGSVSAKIIPLNGTPHIISVTRDITERKQLELALQESNQKFREMADMLPQVVFEADVDGVLTYLNRQANATFGYDENEKISDLPGFNLSHLIDKARHDGNSIVETAGVMPVDHEYFLLRKDLTTFPALIYSSPFFRNGSLAGIRGLIIDISDRKEIEEALRESEGKYRVLFMESPDAFLIIVDGIFVDCNRAAEDILGFDRRQIVGKSPADLSPETQPDGQKSSISIETKINYALHVGFNMFEWLHIRSDGSEFFVEVSIVAITQGHQSALFTSWRDITARKRAEDAVHEIEKRYRLLAENNTDIVWSLGQEIAERERAQAALSESEQRYRLLAENTSDVIWVFNPESWQILYISPSVMVLLGYTPDEVLAMPFPEILTKEERESFQQNVSQWSEKFSEQADSAMRYRRELRHERKDGSAVWAETLIHFYHNKTIGQVEIQGVSRDITERKRLEEELSMQATTDELTRIYNRRHFLKVAQIELRRAVRFNHPIALAIIDLDYFKQINDTYGHAAGDQALIQFSEIFQKNIRDIDTFARFGGDEFVLLFVEIDCHQAYQVAERLRQFVASHTFNLGGNMVSISLTAGIAGSAPGSDLLDDLIMRADRVLYQAKQAGRNRVQVEGQNLTRS